MTEYGDDLGVGSAAPVASEPPVELGAGVPDSWNIDDVKEERQLMEPQKDVKFVVKTAEHQCLKEGIERTWKWIDVCLVVAQGYDVAGVIKYEGKHEYVRICYYASHEVYVAKEADKAEPSKRPYDKQIAASQHLLDLKAFVNAACPSVKEQLKGNFEGLDDASAALICDAVKGQHILGTITQGMDGGELVNKIRYFKPLADTDLV